MGRPVSVILALCAILQSTAAAAQTATQITPAQIPAESLIQALNTFAAQTGLQLMYVSDIAEGRQTRGVPGGLSAKETLARLLEGTDLTFEFLNERTVAIRAKPPGVASTQKSTAMPEMAMTEARLAQSQAPQSPVDRAGAAVDQQQSTQGIEEILVTAQKRSERLIDVPTSITSISGERLESLGVQSLADLANYTPGLAVTSGGAPGYRTLTLRGISSTFAGDNGGPLVGTYIDDVPIGSSTGTARGNLFGLDLMPYDIERVEVLEGPQGTLYGANTLGGLIKYTLTKPDLTQFQGRVGTYVQQAKGSNSSDWGIRGSASLPLISDKLALHVSGFKNTVVGWIDNNGVGKDDSNHSTEEGGRATLLWQATDRLAVSTTVLYQDVDADDTSVVSISSVTRKPIYGWNKVKTAFQEPFKQQTRDYSLNINWNLDFATLTSTSAWSKMQSTFHEDYPGLGFFVPNNPDALTRFDLTDTVSKFVQEVRITSSSGERLQWLLGAYYTREYGGETASVPSFTPAYVLLPLADNILTDNGQSNAYREPAGFGSVTYKVNSAFDITAGVRYSSYSQESCPGQQGGLFGATTRLPCTHLPDQGVASWMGNARFHFNDTSMVYARFSTAYRPGFGCPTCKPLNIPPAPGIIKPDKTTNYELGVKGEFLDRRHQLTASLFDVRWRDIQVSALYPLTPTVLLNYSTNAGTAQSTGAQITSLYQATQNLRFNSTLAYTDARLTENTLLGVGGRDGDQLPVSPRWTASFTVDYQKSVGDQKSLLLGGGYRYRDMIVNQFSGSSGGSLPTRPQNIIDLYTGIEFNRLELRLYGKNVFNNLSYTGLEFITEPASPKFVPIQPRTVGLSADYRFGRQ